MTLLQSHVDHLVIAAESLEQGVAWCEQTLGVSPHAGGEHPLMGTHNRLVRIASDAFPCCYLEIIAIDPAAPDPGRTRWFDLDDPGMRASLRRSPRLVHFVARTSQADTARAAWSGMGLDPGLLLQAERPTPEGVLRWRITIRADGRRQFGGTLPTLIEWAGRHPCDSLPPSELRLQSLALRHPEADRLREALERIGLSGVSVAQGGAELVATLGGPRDPVRLSSPT
jgi:hypothetical protein